MAAHAALVWSQTPRNRCPTSPPKREHFEERKQERIDRRVNILDDIRFIKLEVNGYAKFASMNRFFDNNIPNFLRGLHFISVVSSDISSLRHLFGSFEDPPSHFVSYFRGAVSLDASVSCVRVCTAG
jgi:hypothetical protein